MSEEELKRELEKLTREQSELRQQAEELARQMAERTVGRSDSSSDSKAARRAASRVRQGQQGADGPVRSQSGQQGQSGEQGQSGQQGQAQGRARTASGCATRPRRCGTPRAICAGRIRGQASARGSRALDKLRETAAAARIGARPTIAGARSATCSSRRGSWPTRSGRSPSELAKTAPGEAGQGHRSPPGRRTGAAGRARAQAARDADVSKARGGAIKADVDARRGRGAGDARIRTRSAQAAAGDAAKELERQQLPERMQQIGRRDACASADARGLPRQHARRSTGGSRRAGRRAAGARPRARQARRQAGVGHGATDDAESQKLSDQLAQARRSCAKMAATSRDLAREQSNGQNGAAASAADRAPGDSQASGGQRGPATPASRPGSAGRRRQRLGRREKLREEYQRQLQETKEPVDQMRRDDPSLARGGGGGFTFESAEPARHGAGDRSVQAGLREVGRAAPPGDAGARERRVVAVEEAAGEAPKDRLAAGADDKAPPATRSRSTATSRRLRGENSEGLAGS